jgi:hypothetical protein
MGNGCCSADDSYGIVVSTYINEGFVIRKVSDNFVDSFVVDSNLDDCFEAEEINDYRDKWHPFMKMVYFLLTWKLLKDKNM